MRRIAVLLAALAATVPPYGAEIPTSLQVPITDWRIELPSPLPAPKLKGSPYQGAAGCVFDGRGQKLDPGTAVELVLRSEVVYAGEQHDRVSHHEAQRRLLDAMQGARPSSAGFEMLHATPAIQRALDRYLRGETSAEEFQAAVDWRRIWGYPFDWYRPIFEALREKRARGAALNVPRAIVHKVAVSGLESLDAEERRFVPSSMRRPDDPAYLGVLRETFRQHAPNPEDASAFSRYVDAMTLWNEGMAFRVVEFLKTHPGRSMVVIAGGFHAVKPAVPDGVARRLPGVRQTSIVLAESKDCPERLPPDRLSPAADLFWLTPPLDR